MPTSRSIAILFAVVLAAPAVAVSTPAESLQAFTVHPELTVGLFASEPMLVNPISIDIDERGRVWMIEGCNYRAHKGLRPAGDRILIVSDRDGDGTADEVKVFWQSPRINTALGICVLGRRVIVSCAPEVMVLHDEDGDDRADERIDVLFAGIGGVQHDHSIHAFHAGADGRLYFNFGDQGGQLMTADGKPVLDSDGNAINDKGRPHRKGMAFRCNPDGSEVTVLGSGFRNNFEACVDSYLDVWQSDNDDDGNKACRINYVMEHGRYGYVDELTGAGWSKARTNSEAETPRRHWRQNDPGVVPTLFITGSGAPSGIAVNEGRHLPDSLYGQIIHCEPFHSLVHAIVVRPDGAGFAAKEVALLQSTDKWFRPVDACVHPDGSLIIADWCDPGVGAHAMGDNQLGSMRGRLYRLTTKGRTAVMPKLDLSTAAGAVEALRSPNACTRHLAAEKLRALGAAAEPALLGLWRDGDPRLRARALHLLCRLPASAQQHLQAALADPEPQVRVTALRAAAAVKADLPVLVARVLDDAAPAVRRQATITLRGDRSPQATGLWAELAARHDGKDRWYLEALGIGAQGNEDATLAAWLAKAGDAWDTPVGRDIVWRSRGRDAAGLLAKIIVTVAPAERGRYFRSFDFLKGPEKEAALRQLSTAVVDDRDGLLAQVQARLTALGVAPTGVAPAPAR